MKFNILKRAFSLTELLIVLVIVAVLFAAMLPMMTKRGQGQTTANEPVWSFVKDDPQMSAYFDPGSPALTSTAYVGYNPKGTDAKPFSKMVLRAKELQNMIQFRIGNDGDGTLAGVFTVTPNNMVMSSRMSGDALDNYNEFVKKGSDNTVLGMNAGSKLKNGSQSVAVGASSSMGGNASSTFSDMVAVGANSNLYSKAKKSVFIGSNVGKTETAAGIENTVAIGASSLGLPTSSGKHNVFMGYNVAGTGMSSSAVSNVILNSTYYGTKPTNNTIIGHKTYEGGYVDAKNITAIGYNACASFNKSINANGSNGVTTCLGYNSASNTGYGGTTKGLGWESDNYDHVFLGGKPNGGFGGRATFEIHNIVPEYNYSTKLTNVWPKNVGPTVVINSHLVVRGNLYIPDSNTGEVAAFSYQYVPQDKPSAQEKGKDRCGRKCLGGRKKFRTGRKCAVFRIILGAVLMVSSIAAAVFTGGSSLALIPSILVGLGVEGGYLTGGLLIANGLDGGSDYNRMKDAHSYTGLKYSYSESGQNGLRCTTSRTSTYPTTKYCPNVLKTSDIRLKAGITENTDALAKILQVQPYHFTFKNDVKNTPQVGVMAQDLEKYFPTAVFNGLDGYKNIRWDEIFFATINSVKALDTTIEKSNSELVIMESDVKDIEKNQRSIQYKIKNINDRLTKLENE